MLLRRTSACPTARFLGSGYTEAEMREALGILTVLASIGYTTLFVCGPRR